MAIDPTARVAEGARIGEGVEIGPYCLVGPRVEIGRGVRLLAHVHVTGATTIGEGAVVYPFASLRHAAAIGALSRRRDPSDHRRALRAARKRHHEYRHRGGRRR